MVYVAFKQAQQFRQHAMAERRVVHTQPKLENIQTWMTFDFINHMFHLPASYLSNTLQIQVRQYPNISLKRYAKTANLDPAYILMQVQNAVGTYASSSRRTP